MEYNYEGEGVLKMMLFSPKRKSKLTLIREDCCTVSLTKDIFTNMYNDFITDIWIFVHKKK